MKRSYNIRSYAGVAIFVWGVVLIAVGIWRMDTAIVVGGTALEASGLAWLGIAGARRDTARFAATLEEMDPPSSNP